MSYPRCIVVLGTYLGLAVWPLAAADWPQWRGASRDGISAEKGLLNEWPRGGPPQVWKYEGLGAGFSSFAIAQGRLFTQGQRGSEQFVVAIDAATGKKLWERVISTNAYQERRGPGPRGTPTVDGQRLYAEAADGTLACLDTKTGAVQWSLNFVRDFGGSIPKWGYSESPLVDGELLIVTPGGPNASVAALDKKTGKTIWKSQSDSAAYSSPVVAEVGGIRHYVVFADSGVMGLAAKDGALLWRYNQVSNQTANVATPVFANGSVFVSSDYGTGAALLKLTADGAKVKATEAYFTKNMKNHYSTAVVVGDFLYGYSSQVLTAMHLKSGEVAWRNRAVGKGQVAYADGKLFLFGEDGVVGLAEADSGSYKERGRFEIPRGSYSTWAQPVISGGKLYLREQDILYCYDIKAK